ncbi:MAG TPA: hypothetical protein VM598_08195 [Bdellovibrionota bacterium]|nr:hypothetical protein [Bdellovibrionota bacterium]
MWHERRRRIRCFYAAVGLVLASIGCKGGTESLGDPKARLTEYISHSFSVKGAGDRDTLAGYLSGDARARLLAWSDDQFVQAFTGTKRQFLKLAIKENKALGENQVNITYEVTYLDQSKGQGHSAKVTTKKLAELTKVEDKWLISEVRNIKEMIEYQNEISFFP